MNPGVLILGGIALYLLVSRRSDAAAYYRVPDAVQYGELIPGVDFYAGPLGFENAPDATYDIPGESFPIGTDETIYQDSVDNWDLQGEPITQGYNMSDEPEIQNAGYSGVNAAQQNKNLAAFLEVIKAGEAGSYGYYTLYGNTKWSGNLSDHPALQGWKGLALPRAYCIAAGYPGGVCFSNAAGAYQFISTTWKSVKDRLGLPDFSPESQDKAAIYLLQDQGALNAIQNGNLQLATQLASRDWASLPGSTAKQGGLSMSQVKQVYASAGGVESGSTIV